MSLVSLPVLLYLFPLTMLTAALVPQKWKRTSLAVGGFAYVSITGGFAAMTLLLLSVLCAWFYLRVRPRHAGAQHRRAGLWQYSGIAIQLLLVLLGKLLLRDFLPLLPLILCAMQNIECIARKTHRSIPTLHDYVCYACELPRLIAGPLLPPERADRAWERRSPSPAHTGAGAALCIRGLFQMVCLALPMQTLHSRLTNETVIQTAMDAWFSLLVFYFACYYGLKGAAQLGQGMGQMLGLSYPDSFHSPLLAPSLNGFFMRFLTPVTGWAVRVLRPAFTPDLWGSFARDSLLLSVLGLLAGRSGCGLFWGIVTALMLTADRIFLPRFKEPVPRLFKIAITNILILFSLGILHSRTLSDSFTFYRLLLGVNGFAFSSSTGYFFRTNWLAVVICLTGLFPVRHFAQGLLRNYKSLKVPGLLCAGIAQLCMLLLSMSELLSRFLRTLR